MILFEEDCCFEVSGVYCVVELGELGWAFLESDSSSGYEVGRRQDRVWWWQEVIRLCYIEREEWVGAGRRKVR